MRSAGIRLEVVLELRSRQRAVEGGDVRRRDARVVTAKETEDGRTHARGLFRRGRPDAVLPLPHPAVKPADPPEPGRPPQGRDPKPPAEQEAQAENPPSP